ncbi:MAG: DUF4494 domain-containing protein [Marinilabiliaceae bacterium]|nr:DUF4494 domain-containing protein [Marinilabiliaceae bacterium]
MQNWFECKIRYTKIDEKTGKEKKVNEPYLVDAISFTEAEERIYREMEAYISGEFTVTNIRKANYSDIFNNDEGDRWYKCKITFVSIDETAGKEKKVANTMLVMASGVKDACDKIDLALTGMTVDYDIVSVSESPILDFFPYFNDDAEPGEKGRKKAEAEAQANARRQELEDAQREDDEFDEDEEELEEDEEDLEEESDEE